MLLRDMLQHLREALARFHLDAPPAETESDLRIDEEGILRGSAWKPKESRRRIEIMVTGDPSRVGIVSNVIDNLQKTMFSEQAGVKNPEFRITAFLDNCIHRTKWSKKPFTAATQARRWHCEQTKTRFADAFEDSKGEFIDDLVLIGHRFDDEMQAALDKAAELNALGVRIHCFHTGQDTLSRAAYEKLADQTNGVFMQLEDQRSIGDVMPILIAYLNDADALLTLQPLGREAFELRRLLRPDAPNILKKD